MYFGFDINNVKLPNNVPLYFIQGDCDYITLTDIVQTYYDSIDTEEKGMFIIKDAGHTPFLDKPDEFCEIVKECLN